MEMNDTSVNDNSSDNVNISEIEEKSFTYFYCPKTEKLIMNCEDSSNRFTKTDCHEFLQNNKISPGFYTCVCQVRKKTTTNAVEYSADVSSSLSMDTTMDNSKSDSSILINLWNEMNQMDFPQEEVNFLTQSNNT